MLISIVDAMMVSGVNSGAMSGVSLTTNITAVFSMFLTGIVTASSILATQRIGKGDYLGAVKEIKKSILISYMIALPLCFVLMFFSPQLILLFFGAVEDPLILEAAMISARYDAVYYLLYPFLICITQVFTCQGKTKVTLVMNVIANLVNVLGNYVMINVVGMGVAGAKMATIFSGVVNIAGTLAFACHKNNPLRFSFDSLRDFLPDWQSVKRVLSLGLPTGFENNLSNFAKLLVTALIAQCGALAVNANSVAHNLTSLFVIGGCAVDGTMSIVVGHCKGAGHEDEVKYFTKYFIFASMAFQAVFAFVILLFLDPLVSGYNATGETAQLAKELTVPYLLVGIPLWTMSYTPPNAMRACGDVKFPMVLAVSTLWICRVGLAYLFYYFISPTIWSIWAASYVDWLVRSIFNFIHLKRGRWLKKKVI